MTYADWSLVLFLSAMICVAYMVLDDYLRAKKARNVYKRRLKAIVEE